MLYLRKKNVIPTLFHFNINIMEEKKELSIKLRPEIVTGKYSNLALITHSNTELVLDFAAMLPGLEQPEVVSRIIMNPEHAKRLMYALQDNIHKYESQYGKITLEAPQGPAYPIGGNGTRS